MSRVRWANLHPHQFFSALACFAQIDAWAVAEFVQPSFERVAFFSFIYCGNLNSVSRRRDEVKFTLPGIAQDELYSICFKPDARLSLVVEWAR